MPNTHKSTTPELPQSRTAQQQLHLTLHSAAATALGQRATPWSKPKVWAEARSLAWHGLAWHSLACCPAQHNEDELHHTTWCEVRNGHLKKNT